MADLVSHGMLVGDAHPTCKEGAIVFGSEEKTIAVCGEERDHIVTHQLT